MLLMNRFNLTIAALVVAIMFGFSVAGAVNLQLPIEPGTSAVTNGHYNTDKHVGRSKYAVDINIGSGDYDLHHPVMAALGGKVTFAGWNSSFGNMVKVAHSTTDTTYYCHLAETPFVVVGEAVSTGQSLGLIGGTPNYPVHLHFEYRVRGYSVQVAFNGQLVPSGNKTYTSSNTGALDRAYVSALGSKVGSPHWWGPTASFDRYHFRDGNKVSRYILIQDYQHGSIVYDACGGARYAFYLYGTFWWNPCNTGYAQANGPSGRYGVPLTKAYLNNSNAQRQEFSYRYVHWIVYSACATENGYPSGTLGMTTAGWNPRVSYRIARIYETGGARNVFGEPAGNAYKVSSSRWRQNFNNGRAIEVEEYSTYSRSFAAKAASESTLPQVFTLNQNYPNPFNPTTTISYSLPTTADVRLDIYNVLGQCIATLVNGPQEAGEHSVEWDAGQYASGVYFYRLSTAEAVVSKKMVLLK